MNKRILHTAMLIVLAIVHVTSAVMFTFVIAINHPLLAISGAFVLLVLAIVTASIIQDIKSQYKL